MFWHTAAITQDNVADGFVKEVSKRICSGARFGSRRLLVNALRALKFCSSVSVVWNRLVG